MTGLTAAEIIQSYPEALRAQHREVWNDVTFDNPDKPCILLGRYLVLSRDSDYVEDDIGLGDSGLNASRFHTMRYRFRQSLHSPQRGKSLVNARCYNDSMLLNPHRIMGEI